MYPIFLMTLMNKETFLAFGYHHQDFIITEIIYILFSHIIAYVNIKCLSWTTCTHTICIPWSNNRYCTVWLLTWSPSSVSPSIPALISFVINFKKNKYSSSYGIHKGNFLQLNTTINKCSYQSIIWQHQHDTRTKIWKNIV